MLGRMARVLSRGFSSDHSTHLCILPLRTTTLTSAYYPSAPQHSPLHITPLHHNTHLCILHLHTTTLTSAYYPSTPQHSPLYITPPHHNTHLCILPPRHNTHSAYYPSAPQHPPMHKLYKHRSFLSCNSTQINTVTLSSSETSEI